MTKLNRRDFLLQTGGLVAAGMAWPAAAQQPAAPLTAQTTRALGATGIQCSLLGQGTGMRGWNGSSDMTRLGREAFVALLEHGHAEGITFFDLADMYGSHVYMREAMKRSIKREDVMILTKAISREPALLRADLERFHKEIGTDYIDVVLMHCLTEPDWVGRYEACRDLLSEAKAKGRIRAVGVSCHNFEALAHAAESEWVDVILARINPFGIKMDDTVENVVPVLQKARAAGKGVLGMKIVGEGALTNEPDRISESVRFVMNLGCVDAFTVGFTSEDQVDDMIGRVAEVRRT